MFLPDVARSGEWFQLFQCGCRRPEQWAKSDGVDDESEATAKGALANVRRFYAGYIDPETHKLFYRASSRS
jgi:hypothetical protein